MKDSEIVAPRLRNRRLRNQGIVGSTHETPHDVVAAFGAMQAQDYLGALWAVGLRMRSATEPDVERALAERSIVRTWPLRGTLHFVAAEDVRWMLELLASRVVTRNAARLERDYELTKSVIQRSRSAVERALEGERSLTREELYAALAKKRIAMQPQRGLHILWRLAHEGLICFGPRRGKQQTFVLLDEWLPSTKPKSREEALGELARRYFASHGPATIADFTWWSGLSPSDAKKAFEIAAPLLDDDTKRVKLASSVHLLPPFDEYTVAYKDRSAVLDPAFAKQLNAGGGMLNAVVVIDGRVAGTWKRALKGKSVAVTPSLFRTLTKKEDRALAGAIDRYAAFLTG